MIELQLGLWGDDTPTERWTADYDDTATAVRALADAGFHAPLHAVGKDVVTVRGDDRQFVLLPPAQDDSATKAALRRAGFTHRAP